MTWYESVWNGGLDPRTADPLDLRQRRTIVGITALLIPVAVLLMTLNLVVAGGTDIPGILVGLVLGIIGIVLQHRFGWSRLAGTAQTAALYFAIIMALRDTGTTDTGWAWLAGVPIMAAMTLGRNAAIGWGFISLGTLWVLCTPGLMGQDPLRTPSEATTFAIETNLFLLTITIPMIAAVEMWNRVQRSLAASVHQLEQEVSRRTDAETNAKELAEAAQDAEQQAQALAQMARDAEQQALEAAEAAEQAGEAKATFLATMSHELRTPMNGVLGATQLLRHTALGPEQDRLVRTIEGSGEVLLSVINDILDVSRIDAGRLTIEHISLPLREVVEEVATALRTRAGDLPVDIVVDVDDALPERILSDPTRLRQILFNLGGNAVKFTEAGTVRLRARDAAGTLRIEVEDSGIGIPADLVPTLFEPFVQAESSTTRRFGGSGLGLAIVQGLVDAMGGTVSASSEEGVGSCFVVELPLDEAPVELAFEPQPSVADDGPLRVLVADDNAVNRMVARGLLQRLGHSVDEVVDGQEAIDAVQSTVYDVVLLDVHMPNVDGLEAARAIRALPGNRGLVPLIALTADALPQHRAQALEAGMDDHLAKPVRLEDLRTALKRIAPSDTLDGEHGPDRASA